MSLRKWSPAFFSASMRAGKSGTWSTMPARQNDIEGNNQRAVTERLGEPLIVQDIFDDKWTLKHGPSPSDYAQHPTIRAMRQQNGKLVDVPIPSTWALSGADGRL